MTGLRRLAAIVLGGLWIASCAETQRQLEQSPMWELAGHPGLLLKVKQHYERNATEENGYCSHPLLEGVTQSEVLSEDPEQLVVALRYYYRDSAMGCDDDDSMACTSFRDCKGFAGRTFTIDKQGEALSVSEMSGPQRGRRQ